MVGVGSKSDEVSSADIRKELFEGDNIRTRETDKHDADLQKNVKVEKKDLDIYYTNIMTTAENTSLNQEVLYNFNKEFIETLNYK